MNKELQTLAQMLDKDFEIREFETEAALKNELTNVLIYLLLNNMERLWAILYRIDVNEQKVKGLFDLQNPKDIAPALADLIIERQKQKIESRKNYKQ
ncbi:MAG: hypothetical protein ACK4K9_02555 [Bacteroidia bacterium]